MTFQGIKGMEGWMFLEYTATWKNDRDFVLDAAEAVIHHDLRGNTQRIAVAREMGDEEIEIFQDCASAGMILRDVAELQKDFASLIIAGRSAEMGCSFQMIFFTQNDVIRISVPDKQYFKDHGLRAFDHYMDEIEISAHRAGAVRDYMEGES